MTDKGIPTILKTDGGPQFASQAFSAFCRQWGIHHVLSSPHHHEANGAAEAAVRVMKALIAKTTTTGRIDVDEFAPGYWNSGTRRGRMASVLPNYCMAGRFAPSCSLTRPP